MNQNDNNIIGKYREVTESIKRNMHLLVTSSSHEIDIKKDTMGYNSRVILSDCLEFLEAVKDDIGGEIVVDPVIGTFLYYADVSFIFTN